MTTMSTQAAQDVASSMSATEIEYTLIDIRAALRVALGLDALDGGSRAAEFAEALPIFEARHNEEHQHQDHRAQTEGLGD